jgi:hypothetical protein
MAPPIGIPMFVPSDLQLQQDKSSFVKKLGMLDWVGLGVFTCASTLFLVLILLQL